MKLIDGVHFDPRRIDAEVGQEFSGDGLRVAEKRIEMRGGIEHKALAFEGAAIASDHVVLLDKQDPQTRARQKISASQPPYTGAYDGCVVGRRGLRPKGLEPATHASRRTPRSLKHLGQTHMA